MESMFWSCLLLTFLSVQGGAKNCNDFYPSKASGFKFNCTLVCGLRFSPSGSNETAVCDGGTSMPVMCRFPKDCNHNAGAYCKSVTCVCEGGQPSLAEFYIFHPDFPRWSICVVPTIWIDPDKPMVPFPWLTLIIVFGILLFFGLCLFVLRWISPYLRKMQSKRESRHLGNRESSDNADALAVFSAMLPPVGSQNSQCRNSSRNRQPVSHQSSIARRFHRARRCISWDNLETIDSPTTCSVAEDKPPPYEIAVQMQQPSINNDQPEEGTSVGDVPTVHASSSTHRAESSVSTERMPTIT